MSNLLRSDYFSDFYSSSNNPITDLYFGIRKKMSLSNQYKMYSITKTARLMRIGKDTLYGLIREGKIGTIKVKMREKISTAEIERFQTENTIRKEIKESKRQNLLQKADPSSGKEIFKSIKEEYLYGKCI